MLCEKAQGLRVWREGKTFWQPLPILLLYSPTQRYRDLYWRAGVSPCRGENGRVDSGEMAHSALVYAASEICLLEFLYLLSSFGS